MNKKKLMLIYKTKVVVVMVRNFTFKDEQV
jgi:hypothetical protein